MVDNVPTVHVRFDDEDPEQTMIGATRNLVLTAGQVVRIDPINVNKVFGSWAVAPGSQAWFQGTLIYAD